MNVRTRIDRLEAQAAFGQDVRKLTDAQLDAEIRALAARIDPADLSPADQVRLRAALERGGTT